MLKLYNCRSNNNILIVVKDIERSKQFCHDLFGLEMILDNDAVILRNRNNA